MNKIGVDVYENFSPMYPLDMHGWMANSEIFEKLITKCRPDTIIEVGTWKGRSAITMSEIVKKLGLDCKIYCIDTWLGALEFWGNDIPVEKNLFLKNGYPQIYYQFLSNVVHTNNQDIITPVPLPSNLAAKLLKNNQIKSQLIYIDGSHETDDVYADMTNYSKLLTPGGIMFGDDYTWYTVKDGVRKFVDENKCGQNMTYEFDPNPEAGPINWIYEKPKL